MAVPQFDAVFADYAAANPASRSYRDRAADLLPGGGTRSSYHFDPFPLVLVSGKGDEVTDIDGNVRLDFNANFGVTIHGHGFAPIVEAIQRQAERALCFAAPVPAEADLASLLRARVPSMQRIRFSSSGTEAMIVALKAARHFTGRHRVAKLSGGYHGSTEFGTATGSPPANAECSPNSDPGRADTSILPAEDLERLFAEIEAGAGELAAVVVEPIQGAAGLIPIRPDVLRKLRTVTRRHGVLLIFDEVMMFRVAFGGVQSLLEIEPDLTVLGKLIGGGLPVGAVGGRADIMDIFNPQREGWVRLAGTYNGNPMTMAAGLACMAALHREDFDRMNALAANLVERSNDLLARHGIPACFARNAAFFCIHALPEPATSHVALEAQDRTLFRALHLGLINKGVLLTPIGLGCVSSRTTPHETDRFVDALGATLRDYVK